MGGHAGQKAFMMNDTSRRPPLLSVAPMMDWTDRHCRFFHRLMSRHALLYTEMITAPAIIHGPRTRLLDFTAAEHPVTLQLGGSVPRELAEAVRIAHSWHYDEINLNCGCPSDRVQSGAFGAILMRSPDLVADCVRAMQAETDRPITVKCRIGIDDDVPESVLPRFMEILARAGIMHFIIHARKAWLKGLSPRENRDIPPLDHALVLRMKERYPELTISLNGGVKDLATARTLLEAGLDGVMIGRTAYQRPGEILLGADSLWEDVPTPDPAGIVLAMVPYIQAHLDAGGRLSQITRHMLGLFHGRPGARGWRQILSSQGTQEGAGTETVLCALSHVQEAGFAARSGANTALEAHENLV